MVIGLCDRFHCLPSQVLAESTDLMRYLAILEEVKIDEQ
jgi:hypothetical protein